MNEEKNAIVLYDKIENPVTAIDLLGDTFAKSGMFGCEKKEQGMILAMQCLSERISPLDLARKYHIIQGKLSMRSDAMLAEFRTRGGKCIWKKTDATEATATFIFEGTENEISFTAKDATLAGLLPAKPGSGWAKYPDALLRARLISKAMRMLCPEAVTGVYTEEEVRDFDEPKKPGFKPRTTTTVQSETSGPDKPIGTAEDLAAAMGDKPDGMISKDQLSAIHALFNAIDVKDAETRRIARVGMINVDVPSNKELTMAQASELIERLKEAKAAFDANKKEVA